MSNRFTAVHRAAAKIGNTQSLHLCRPTTYLFQHIRNKSGRLPNRSKISRRAHHYLARTLLDTVDLERTAEGGGVLQAKNGTQRCGATRLRGR